MTDPLGMLPQAEPEFKPFTDAEVASICFGSQINEWVRLLDWWLKKLPPRIGDDGKSIGLEYMQTFAVYCGRRYLEEGAGQDRADRVVRMIGGMKFEGFMFDLEQGRDFPNIRPPQMLVPAPSSRLGRTLNLTVLHAEFRARLDRVFPERGVTWAS